jgi:hypothetical protein
MTQQGPLVWVDGEGWLVLLGGGDWQRGETDAADARLLSVVNLDRPMIVLCADGSQIEADTLLEHYTLLGGPGGEAFVLPDLLHRNIRAARFLAALAEAGLLFLSGSDPRPFIKTFQGTPALGKIVEAFTTLQGLVIVGAGGGAAALGAYLLTENASPIQGLAFLPNVIIAPYFERANAATTLRSQLRHFPGLLGLGVPAGTALALGPQGQVETWGPGQVTAVVHLPENEAGNQ